MASLFLRAWGRGRPTRTIDLPVTDPSLPQDVIAEILSWVPIPDLLRMKCVCKNWSATIQSRSFIEKHMKQASRDVPVYNILVNTTASSGESYKLVCACDGLCLKKNKVSGKYFISNFAIKQTLDLPDPCNHSLGMTFSHVSSTNEYKLVSISAKGWEILTLGKDSSWRPLQPPNTQSSDMKREIVDIVSSGSAVHHIKKTQVQSKFVAEIVSLDLKSESFTRNGFPLEHSDWQKVWPIDWNGSLCFACISGDNLKVTVLEDYKKIKWAKEIVIPLAVMKERNYSMEELVPLHAKSGRLWFWLKDKKILGCDIKTMKIKDIIGAEGERVCQQFYDGSPSLVSLKEFERLELR